MSTSERPPAPGTVLIRDLEIRCIVGVLPRERIEPQILRLDVELDLDLAPAAAAEAVEHTVDYAAVAAWLAERALSRAYRLVETLAVESCRDLLARHPSLTRAAITVKKPAAVPAAAWVGCRYEARRSPP